MDWVEDAFVPEFNLKLFMTHGTDISLSYSLMGSRQMWLFEYTSEGWLNHFPLILEDRDLYNRGSDIRIGFDVSLSLVEGT